MMSRLLTVSKCRTGPALGVGIDAFAGMKYQRAYSPIPLSIFSLIRIIEGR